MFGPAGWPTADPVEFSFTAGMMWGKRRLMRTMWAWGLLAVAAVGCAVPSDDASDELDTKAGIAEGTREAYAILHFLETPTHDNYGYLINEVHMPSKAATGISKYVLG